MSILLCILFCICTCDFSGVLSVLAGRITRECGEPASHLGNVVRAGSHGEGEPQESGEGLVEVGRKRVVVFVSVPVPGRLLLAIGVTEGVAGGESD